MNTITSQFLSPDDLDLTQKEFDAFVKVYHYLNTVDLPIAPHARAGDVPRRVGMKTSLGFSMNYECRPVSSPDTTFECGAVACIGGHISLVLQGVDVLARGVIHISRDQADEAIHYTFAAEGALYQLFFPKGAVADGKWSEVRSQTAAIALRNYLTTGSTDWPAALTEGGQPELIQKYSSED